MADKKELQIILTAKDNASRELKSLGGSLTDLKDKTISLGSVIKSATVGLGVVAGGFAYVLKETTKSSNELNNALLGLNSVATAFKQDTALAKQAAIDLAKDGLMSVKSAADSLKNLLATGFSLPEAINLMYAFKDAAAFNRQGTLEFGQAIEGATQGIKNQNSILVDNAGITKNLSIILKDAGYNMSDLSKVTSDASVRQALYNGIIKEASIFQGDAARMAGTLTGQQAALATQIFNVKAAIGDALAPVMQMIITEINNAIVAVGGPEGIKNKFMQYQNTIMSVVQVSLLLVKGIAVAIDWFDKFANMIGTVIYNVERAINAIVRLKREIGGNLSAGFSYSVNAVSGLFGGGRAIGGPVSAGTSYLVGEKGPELFVPSTNGRIIPNGGGGLTINITGNTLLDSRAGEKIGDMIIGKLGLNVRL